MVFGFIICSLDRISGIDFSSPLQTLPVQVFIAQFYSPEGNDKNKYERQQYIASKVQGEYSFVYSCYSPDGSLAARELSLDWGTHSLVPEPNKSVSSKWANEGVFRIVPEDALSNSQSPLFKKSKIVIWKQIVCTAYILICEEDENRLLASQFLNIFTKAIDDHFKKPGVCGYPKEFLSRVEEFLVLMNVFLPNGQLLFISTPFAKYLRKEAESMLFSK